jgi:phospholipid transport system substrate-binding protein
MQLHRQRKLAVMLVATIGLAGVAEISRAGEPLDLVKSVVEGGIAVLKDPKLKSPEQKRERVERLKEIINPIFDYNEMARRSLGAHWRRRSPAEQEEFIRLFRAFLEKIYSDKLDFYDGQRVMFGRETIDQEYAQVDSIMTNSKGEENSLVYRLKRTDGKWKVYDAVVENISIVNNYRSQFDRVISKSSYEELKKMLREKAA